MLTPPFVSYDLNGETRELKTLAYNTTPKSSKQIDPFHNTPFEGNDVADVSIVSATGWTEDRFQSWKKTYDAWNLKHGAAWRKSRMVKPPDD